MLMLTLAISCLTTSNLPWFMDPTFQVTMQCCSLQHQTWLPSLVTTTAGWCFCFGSMSSFFLELFLHWSPLAYWAPTNLGVHLSVSYLFAFSYCSWSSQSKNTEVVYHFLLQWTTFCQIFPPWPDHLGWPQDQISNIHWIMEKAREFQKKHLFLLYWLCQSLWLCGSPQIVENSERDGNIKPPYLPPEKYVCRSRSNS